MKQQIPNLITLLNLLCGCAALISLWQGAYFTTALFMAAAALADFADGLAARALKVTSEEGKELDSLADLISFGLIPGAILYTLLFLSENPDSSNLLENGIAWYAFPAFLLTGASALRLARFNLDERQTEGFIGLATPACTIFILGLLMIHAHQFAPFSDWISQKWVLYAIILVFSYLLLAEIPMFSFKIKQLRWEGNALRIIFAASALGLLLIWREVALAPIVLIYILINVVRHFSQKRRAL